MDVNHRNEKQVLADTSDLNHTPRPHLKTQIRHKTHPRPPPRTTRGCAADHSPNPGFSGFPEAINPGTRKSCRRDRYQSSCLAETKRLTYHTAGSALFRDTQLAAVYMQSNMPGIYEIHHVMEGTVNTLSILFNVYLLYLIKCHSAFGVKLYQYLLTIDSLLDLTLSISAFIAHPVVFTADGYCTMMSNGFFAGRSASFDSFTVMVYLTILHTNIIWIPVQFIYRYLLLCKKNNNLTRSTIFVITVAVAQSAVNMFLNGCVFGEARDEFQPIGHHVLELNSWPHTGMTYVLGRHVDEWQLIVMLVSWNVTCGGSIFIVAWCENRIAKNFDQLTQHSTHSGTQKMHKEFQRALLAMAICPLVTSTIPVFYFIAVIALKLRPGPILALITICLTSVTLINPLDDDHLLSLLSPSSYSSSNMWPIGKPRRNVVNTTSPSGITSTK